MRDDTAGEVKRPAGEVGDNLDHMGISNIGRTGHRVGRGDHAEPWVVLQRPDQTVDGRRRDIRFVALHIEDDCCRFEFSGNLGQPVRAGRMLGRGQRHFRPESESSFGDAHVVRRDDDPPHTFGAVGAFPNVLDKRFTAQFDQWLAGKTGRGPAGGDDNGYFRHDDCLRMKSTAPTRPVAMASAPQAKWSLP